VLVLAGMVNLPHSTSYEAVF